MLKALFVALSVACAVCSAQEYGNKTITKVLDNIYVAENYGLANVHMIVGTDGIIIMDTTENSEIMAEVMTEFRKITTKPIKAIIITHFHADHTRGFRYLMENQTDGNVEVICHRALEKELTKSLLTADGTLLRTIRQFGLILPDSVKDEVRGPKLYLGSNSDNKIIRPTRAVDDKLFVRIAGITLQFLHIPGETVDQIAVWYPRKRVLFPADLIYPSFPNIFTLRGETPRSSHDWFTSIDQLRRLRPRHLVPNHMSPIVNDQTEISTFMTNYRDAVQFVNDQTTRLFNKRMHIDDIVRKVKLPSTLAPLDYMDEWYGTVEWAVRSIHSNLSGWYHGEARELFPLTYDERASKTIEMVAGVDMSAGSAVDNMLDNCEMNLQKSQENIEQTGKILYQESQWALELADLSLRGAQDGSPEKQRAAAVKMQALNQMVNYSGSINAIYYFLSTALELQIGGLNLPFGGNNQLLINELRMNDLLPLLSLGVDADTCDPTEIVRVWLYLSDLPQMFGLTYRNCVLEVSGMVWFGNGYDVKVSTTSQVMRDILSEIITPDEALQSDQLEEKGNFDSFKRILSLVLPFLS